MDNKAFKLEFHCYPFSGGWCCELSDMPAYGEGEGENALADAITRCAAVAAEILVERLNQRG